MKKIKTALLASTALIAASSAALSQVTITGYIEAAYITGGSSGPNIGTATITPNGGTGTGITSGNDIARTIGREAQLRFTSTHKLGAFPGYSAAGMVELRRLGAVAGAASGGYEESELRFQADNGSFLAFVGHDTVRGNEVARNVYPTVGNRASDIIGGLTGIIDPLDATSGESFLGFELPQLAGGRLSVAYAPNIGGGGSTAQSQNNSDGLMLRTNDVKQNQTRASVGYRNNTLKVGPGTLDVGVGYMGGTVSGAVFQKPQSQTIGLGYRQGMFAVGAQKFKNTNDNVSAATATKENQTTYSVTAGLTKELSIGYARTKQSLALAGVKDPDEIRQNLFQLAYNLGPASLGLDYAKIDNANYSGGTELTPIKAKFRVNF